MAKKKKRDQLRVRSILIRLDEDEGIIGADVDIVAGKRLASGFRDEINRIPRVEEFTKAQQRQLKAIGEAGIAVLAEQEGWEVV
jgi:hypothetical protein